MSISKILIFILLIILPLGYYYRQYDLFREFDSHLFVLSIAFLFTINFTKIKYNHFYINIDIVSCFIIFSLLLVGSIQYAFGIVFSQRLYQLMILSVFVILITRSSYISNHKFLVIDILCFLLLIHSLWGLLQYGSSGLRSSLVINGIFTNSGTFANYIMTLVPFTLCAIISQWGLVQSKLNTRSNVSSKAWVPRICFYSFAFVAGVTALAFTQSRSAWLGGLVGCTMAIYSTRSKFKVMANIFGIKGHLISWIKVLVLSILVALPFILALTFKKASATGRVQIYNIDYLIFKQNPFVGIGIGNIYSQFNEYQALYFKDTEASLDNQLLAYNTYEAFNILFHVAIETGLIGLLAFIILITMIWRTILRNNEESPLILGASVSLVAIFVSSLFSNFFHQLPNSFMALFLLGLIPHPQIKITNIKLWFIRILQILVLCLACIWIIKELERIQALSMWKKAAFLAAENKFIQADEYYGHAWPTLSTNGRYLYNYGAELYVANQFQRSIEVLNMARKYYSSSELYTYLGSAYHATGQYQYAEQSYLHAINMTPAFFYPKYKLFKHYLDTNQLFKAEELAWRILKYPVKVDNETTRLIKEDIRKYLSKKSNK